MDENKIKKDDFIELEFIGKIKGGNIFDTNIKEEAEKLNLNIETRPLIICIEQGMILPAIDEFLIGKERGRYELELSPEKAFGQRRRDLIKTMPSSVFKNQNIVPQAGMIFNFDNLLGRISAVSGGRVIVDFNNPLAGKMIIYELNVKRIINNLDEKIKFLILFFFRMDLKYELREKRLIVEAEKSFSKFIALFKPKFKEILDLELEIKEIEDKKPMKENKEDEKAENIVNQK